MCQEHYDKVVQYAEASATARFGNVWSASNAVSKIPIIRARSNFTGTSRPIRSSSRNAIPTGVWALSADWFIMDVRIGRAVLSTVPFTAGRPTPEKPVIYAYENFALCCRQGQSVRRCPYHRIRPSSGSVYPICPVSAATNDERQDTTLEGVCRTKHGNCISSG